MTITAIEKVKGDRYTVYVNGEYWYILDAEIILLNHLRKDMEVDEEFLDSLRVQAERRTARERAYYLLGYRDHSAKELYDKLLKNARPEIAAEIVALMQEQGYINDEDYAGKLARYFLQSKRWGARKALFEMTRRGIDRETAQAAIGECDVDYVEQIRQIIDRKYARYLNDGDYKGKQKVIAALMRIGYGYDDIKAAISAYLTADSGEDEYYD